MSRIVERQPGTGGSLEAPRRSEEVVEHIHDVLFHVSEITSQLPVLNAMLFEPGIDDEERQRRERLIPTIVRDIGTLSDMAALLNERLSNDASAGMSFTEIYTHPEWNRLTALLKQVDNALQGEGIAELLQSAETELNKETRAPLPPEEFDPAWYDIEDIELANLLLVYELEQMKEDLNGQDEKTAKALETVMHFLVDEDLLKHVAAQKDKHESVIDEPPTLSWIQRKEPKVWDAIVLLSKNEIGQQFLRHIIGQPTAANDVFDVATDEQRKGEMMEKLPNTLAIAIGLSRDRLSHENSTVRTEEQNALEAIYGRLDVEVQQSVEDMVFDLQREKLVADIKDEGKKEILDTGLRLLKKPTSKEALQWDGWGQFVEILLKSYLFNTENLTNIASGMNKTHEEVHIFFTNKLRLLVDGMNTRFDALLEDKKRKESQDDIKNIETRLPSTALQRMMDIFSKIRAVKKTLEARRQKNREKLKTEFADLKERLYTTRLVLYTYAREHGKAIFESDRQEKTTKSESETKNAYRKEIAELGKTLILITLDRKSSYWDEPENKPLLDVSHFYLGGADLQYRNLSDFNMRNVDLRGADLREASLCGTDLHGADLREVDLRGADLREVYLHGASLREADWRGADLREAILPDDCSSIDFSGARLDWEQKVFIRLHGGSVTYSKL